MDVEPIETSIDGDTSQSLSRSFPNGSKHVVLGPLTSEGVGCGVESGSLIQWNPEEYLDAKVSYGMTCGCPLDWKSRLRSPKLVWDWAKSNKRELMAAITVTLTLVPTTVAFAFLAGVDPGIALTGSWIIGLIAAAFGGRTGMIYCSAGSVAVVVVDIVKEKGVEYMFYAFILAGMITTILAWCKVANIMKLLPASCMIGFVNGLAIVIFLSQLENFTEANTVPGPLRSFEILTNDDWISWPTLAWMLANVFISMAANWCVKCYKYGGNNTAAACGLDGWWQTLFFWNTVTIFLSSSFINEFSPYIIPWLPGAFVGIVTSTVFEWGIVRGAAGSRTNTVKDVAKVSGSFPIPIWLNSDYSPPPLTAETFGDILPTAISITAVSLIEVLMTVRLVDELTESKGDPHKESIWLGVSNVVAGIFGGQGGNSEIGLTLINIHSGARLRVSAVVTAILTLCVIMFLYPVINIMPIAGLVGVMFVVICKIFEFSSLKMMFFALMTKNFREKYFPGAQKISRMDAFIILTVTVLTPFTNLAIAVACGCGIAFLSFSWKSSDSLKIYSYCRSGIHVLDPSVIKVYEIRGPLFFGSVGRFLDQFDCHSDPELIEIHFNQADIFDLSAIRAINTIGERYNRYQKRVRLRRIKNSSLKVLMKANNLLTDLVSLEMESNFEKPGPLAHLNVENYSETVQSRVLRDNYELREFLRGDNTNDANSNETKNENGEMGENSSVDAAPTKDELDWTEDYSSHHPVSDNGDYHTDVDQV